ncbi:hypothetical protein F4804DRAFT_347195 [Jackrogersella minutella]|nr:hypothetical protein F4804DRAFT_347195 [Jackrogersella minutella]
MDPPISVLLTGGKLLRAAAPGAVCHSGQPAYNIDQCAIVTAGWYTYDFHRNDPVSNMWQRYNNDTCLPDADTLCARLYNIRVIVKSTSHDYQGRSQASRSLSIWARYICNFSIERPAVTVAGGSQLGDIDDELGKIYQTAVGGNGKSVSAFDSATYLVASQGSTRQSQ